MKLIAGFGINSLADRVRAQEFVFLDEGGHPDARDWRLINPQDASQKAYPHRVGQSNMGWEGERDF